jgi:hypothetical protein
MREINNLGIMGQQGVLIDWVLQCCTLILIFGSLYPG